MSVRPQKNGTFPLFFFSKIRIYAAAADHKAGADDLLGKQRNPQLYSGIMMLLSEGNDQDY